MINRYNIKKWIIIKKVKFRISKIKENIQVYLVIKIILNINIIKNLRISMILNILINSY